MTSATTVSEPLVRPSAGKVAVGDDGGGGAAGERHGGEVVAVEAIALDGEEGLAGRDACGCRWRCR